MNHEGKKFKKYNKLNKNECKNYFKFKNIIKIFI